MWSIAEPSFCTVPAACLCPDAVIIDLEEAMECQFRGDFADNEKEHLKRAAARYERMQETTLQSVPAWAFVHFKTPYKGSLYWGVRTEDGYMVKARTARGLAVAVDTAREEKVRRRSRAIRQASRTVNRSIQSSGAASE